MRKEEAKVLYLQLKIAVVGSKTLGKTPSLFILSTITEKGKEFFNGAKETAPTGGIA